MPTVNVAVSNLESYQPAVDFRNSGQVGVLSGSNFAWDASGVYSAYASRLISGSASIGKAPSIVQTLDLETQTHIAVDGTRYRLNPSSPGSPIGNWQWFGDLPPLVTPSLASVPYNFRKWTTAFLGGKPYACAWNYGVFEVDVNAEPPTYTRLTSVLNPGFPADATPVIAIAETNGRMMYLTEQAIYWSAPNAPKNLTPALGGAGFQVIAERIAGKPIAITPTSQGAIIWTDTGALVCEFIGGDTVFRFWVLPTQALPISSFAITRLPSDDYIILTKFGLYAFSKLSQPTPISPLFGEFLREYLRTKPNELGHLWFSQTENRLYVSFRESLVAFSETFTLDIMLDRWGMFNESHMGFFDYGVSRGQIAYATTRGVASFLLSSLDSRKNREDPNNPGQFIGLSSEITIGWIRAQNLIAHADVVQELNEIAVNRLIPFAGATTVFVDEGYITELTFDSEDEGSITDLSFDPYDEGLITTSEEVSKYKLAVYSDIFTEAQDDSDVYAFELVLARENRRSDLWVTLAPALYFRLRFYATDVGEFYRVNSMNLTVSYNGNLS